MLLAITSPLENKPHNETKEVNPLRINGAKIKFLKLQNTKIQRKTHEVDMEEKKSCECCGKRTERSEEERKKLINRLNRIEGQIRGLKGMVERNEYCTDILIQSAAVNAAVNAFNKDLISNHIKGCVVRDIKEGKEEVIDELVATLQKLMK